MEVRVRRVVGGDEEEKLWMVFALSLPPAADHGGAEVQILFNPPY